MDDLRHAPLYSIPECARYLGLPVSTVRRWVAAPGSNESDDDKPLVCAAGSDPTALSFTNLVELFVISSLRRNREPPTRRLLKSVMHLTRGNDEPERHSHSKVDFCINRIEYDGDGLPVRFYPFTRGFGGEDPKLIAIDPAVKFGRPVIAGTGVRTEVIAHRIKAGEPFPEIADDYLLNMHQIEEAVRYELAF